MEHCHITRIKEAKMANVKTRKASRRNVQGQGQRQGQSLQGTQQGGGGAYQGGSSRTITLSRGPAQVQIIQGTDLIQAKVQVNGRIYKGLDGTSKPMTVPLRVKTTTVVLWLPNGKTVQGTCSQSPEQQNRKTAIAEAVRALIQNNQQSLPRPDQTLILAALAPKFFRLLQAQQGVQGSQQINLSGGQQQYRSQGGQQQIDLSGGQQQYGRQARVGRTQQAQGIGRGNASGGIAGGNQRSNKQQRKAQRAARAERKAQRRMGLLGTAQANMQGAEAGLGGFGGLSGGIPTI